MAGAESSWSRSTKGRVIDALDGARIMFVSDRKRKLMGVIFAGKEGQTH